MRAALLDASEKLFLKHGFERVSERQIAALAGTTPAMIQYYFEDKLGLFRAMHMRTEERKIPGDLHARDWVSSVVLVVSSGHRESFPGTGT
jgi:AcrR family transcriptional regulator